MMNSVSPLAEARAAFERVIVADSVSVGLLPQGAFVLGVQRRVRLQRRRQWVPAMRQGQAGQPAWPGLNDQPEKRVSTET
jgi:hypothetical protein